MKTPIASVQELGLLLRAVRQSSGVRLDDLAASAGVSKQFMTDLERGKPTIQMGLVLKVLAEIGLTLEADTPDAAQPALERLRAKAQAKALVTNAPAAPAGVADVTGSEG